jgi:hypothetical protein
MKQRNWRAWLKSLTMNVDTNDTKSFHCTLKVNLKLNLAVLAEGSRYENISFKKSPTNQRQSGIDNASILAYKVNQERHAS